MYIENIGVYIYITYHNTPTQQLIYILRIQTMQQANHLVPMHNLDLLMWNIRSIVQ